MQSDIYFLQYLLLCNFVFIVQTVFILIDPEEYSTYLESRPPKMELNAISLISTFLNKTE